MILVTGASGLLGANLVMTCLSEGQEVALTYHTHRVSFDGVKGVQADLSKAGAISDLLREVRPEWIIHCAAMTNVDQCEKNPDEARRLNLDLSRELARSACDRGCGMVYISTDSVFDGTGGTYREEDNPGPVNVYAKTKLAGEEAVLRSLERALVVRTNIYGWNVLDKESLSEWFLARLQRGEEAPGFVDVFFSPILANDLSRALLEMIRRNLTGVYHVASRESCSKFEFGQMVADVFHLDRSLIRPTSIEGVPLLARRPKNMSLDVSKFVNHTKRKLPGLTEGMARFRRLWESGYVTALKSHKGAEDHGQDKTW